MEVDAIALEDRSLVGEARRRAVLLAKRTGLGETDAGRAAIVVTELASNAVKHGRDGWCFLAARADRTLEVAVVDAGRGIQEVEAALRDGFSTAGTPGTGLGAVRRQSTRFDLWTAAGRGTAVTARIGELREEAFDAAVFAAPRSGIGPCGDGCAVHVEENRLYALVADGLGHGPDAAAASAQARAQFRAAPAAPVEQTVAAIHERLRSTRGAAIAVVSVDAAARTVRFAGIGNVAGRIVAPDGSSQLVSMNGTAGHHAGTIRAFDHELPDQAFVVLHTDGLTSRWDLATSPGLANRSAALVAAVLLRDHWRRTDDGCVLVVRPMTASQRQGAGR